MCIHFQLLVLSKLNSNGKNRATVDSNQYNGHWKNPGSIDDSTYHYLFNLLFLSLFYLFSFLATILRSQSEMQLR